MKRIIVAAVLLSAGCAKPLDEAKIGDMVSAFHVIDAKTGACLAFDQFLDSQKWRVLKVADAECRPEGK